MFEAEACPPLTFAAYAAGLYVIFVLQERVFMSDGSKPPLILLGGAWTSQPN
jgi:hypothetical protein